MADLRPRRRYGIAALATFVSASAAFGAIGLVTGLLPLDAAMSANLPFHSPVFAGIALAVIVGLPSAWVAGRAGRRHPRTAEATTFAGLLLVGWIVVEVAVIREFSGLQLVYAAAGIGLIALGSSETLRELGSAVAVLPVILTAPLYRPWHLRWGATRNEIDQPMLGDERVPGAQFVATRAITIGAPPEQVWGWLTQVGIGRAGFYSVDLFDNLGRPSAEEIHPQWQHERIGELAAPMTVPATRSTSFTVVTSDQPNRLVWAKPDSTWSWQLTELAGGRTRLVTRLRARYHFTPAGLLTVVLMEFGDFAMMRAMLRGLKRRAESARLTRSDWSVST